MIRARRNIRKINIGGITAYQFLFGPKQALNLRIVNGVSRVRKLYKVCQIKGMLKSPALNGISSLNITNRLDESRSNYFSIQGFATGRTKAKKLQGMIENCEAIALGQFLFQRMGWTLLHWHRQTTVQARQIVTVF